MCTKPRQVEDLLPGGFWEAGPGFLRSEESSWSMKLTFKENLEGDIPVLKKAFVIHVDTCAKDFLSNLVDSISTWRRIHRILAWVLQWPKKLYGYLRCEMIKVSKTKLVKMAQEEMCGELKKAADEGKGKYRKLAPVLDEDGVWRVGSRLRNFVPFTFDNKLPAILPPDSKLTTLIMEDSHQFCHGGQDSTLSRFRSEGFWTLKGGCVAKRIKRSCVPCRKVDHKLLFQPMGEFSGDILKEPVAWGVCQMDMSGPHHCRGDVNPRTTKKTWIIVIVDVNSGAVHLDIVQDYSTAAVLLSMRRFGALRGWPGEIHTDPGSQLESASGKLESWWSRMEESLRGLGSSKNFKWIVSPPDSPWRQGKAE